MLMIQMEKDIDPQRPGVLFIQAEESDILMYKKLKFKIVIDGEIENEFIDNRPRLPNTTLMRKFSKN